MPIFTRFAIIFGKIISLILRFFHLGAGLTWPGEVALRLSPSILRDLAGERRSIILVSGTNGKTTTVKMLEIILMSRGIRVCRNPSGANLDNGIVSGFIRDATWTGRLRSEIYIFEVDEASLSKVASSLNPRIIVLLNLFRDQLDRYGEVDAIADKWMSTLSTLSERTHFILNGDDPHIAFIGSTLPGHVSYFGLNEPAFFLPVLEHATDSLYCPKCGNRLTFGGVYFAHLGKWACGRCGLTHPDLFVTARDFQPPVSGIYNIYNTLAAGAIAKVLGLLPNEIQHGLSRFTPAFGRFEKLQYRGKSVTLLLSKNPAGFNESLRTVKSAVTPGPVLLILNDRVPDGKDVSWIWDVDFETIAGQSHRVGVSGDRCYDLAVRLKHAGMKNVPAVYSDFKKAIDEMTAGLAEGETFWILPTYSAMLDARQYLTGNKID